MQKRAWNSLLNFNWNDSPRVCTSQHPLRRHIYICIYSQLSPCHTMRFFISRGSLKRIPVGRLADIFNYRAALSMSLLSPRINCQIFPGVSSNLACGWTLYQYLVTRCVRLLRAIYIRNSFGYSERSKEYGWWARLLCC